MLLANFITLKRVHNVRIGFFLYVEDVFLWFYKEAAIRFNLPLLVLLDTAKGVQNLKGYDVTSRNCVLYFLSVWLSNHAGLPSFIWLFSHIG